jgi:hypothetical protein
MSRLPRSAHTERPWRIHEIAPDFALEDVWALPTPGGPGDFPRLVEALTSLDPGRSASLPVRALFALRWAIGGLLGWDDPGAGLGSRVERLRDRLPEDLLYAPPSYSPRDLPFEPLYLLEDEWAAEIANRTVHGVLHLGWVPDGAGGHRGQMAVLVKRNGLLGAAYMAAITPFRHTLVYPALLREIGRRWDDVTPPRPAPAATAPPRPTTS